LPIPAPAIDIAALPVLCVDLDGTLVKSDTLHDSALAVARHHPAALLNIPDWLVQGKAVLTTVREFRLLEYLARHRGRVFTRDQLLDAVWKEGSFVTPRSIDVFVRRLREKIERDPRHPLYLKTLRGIGYRFEAGR